MKKTELAAKAAAILHHGEVWPEELKRKLLDPIRQAITQEGRGTGAKNL